MSRGNYWFRLDRILINDISRQLASYLDQCALYGGGPSANQATGLINVPGVAQGVAINATDPHGSFCALEAQIEAANVSIDAYGVIVSLPTRQILRTTPSFPGGSITSWAELRGGQSSPEVTDGRCFAGCWNNMTFYLWGSGVQLLIDSTSLALNNQIEPDRLIVVSDRLVQVTCSDRKHPPGPRLTENGRHSDVVASFRKGDT